MFKNEDTARLKAIVTSSKTGWTTFISVIAIVLTLLGLSITAAYKASATEKQTEINTKDIEQLQEYGERITRIETTVEFIRDEQQDIKDTQDEIKTDTRDILIELKAIQRSNQTGNPQ